MKFTRFCVFMGKPIGKPAVIFLCSEVFCTAMQAENFNNIHVKNFNNAGQYVSKYKVQFLLEVESTQVYNAIGSIYINEKFQCHQLGTNRRPTDL